MLELLMYMENNRTIFFRILSIFNTHTHGERGEGHVGQ